jgi:hypothetical protein
MLVVAPALVLLAAVMLAVALSASPARAFSSWQHNGATGCVCHGAGTPTDASCVSCHTGFKSYPAQTCWACHYPGQDTSTLSTPGTACSQECHLWNSAQKSYMVPSTHGTNPHLGSGSDCTACHPTSVSVFDPGSSPHHSGQATGFGNCGACHGGLQQHAGKLQCTQCHTSATEFHLYATTSPGFKKCRDCHAMKHAGKKVANNRCATCHKGTGRGAPSAAQHAKSVSKRFTCGACHSQRRHASAVSTSVKDCRTCHRGRYHAAQRTPGKSACTSCHSIAKRHDNGFRCTLCHRRAVHNPRPSAVN